MALSRKLLKGMGLTEEQVDTIIEAHTETVDGLKTDINKYKGDAEKLPGVLRELDELKAEKDDGYKEKYEKEHAAFEDFKKTQKGKETKEAKEKAYRELLKEVGVSEKRIDTVMKVFVADEIELDDSGKIKDADKVTESVKKEWADFIVQTQVEGVKTPTPPNNGGGGIKTREDIMKITDRQKRREAIAQNMNLFEKES